MRRRAVAALGVANALTAVTALTVAVVGHGAPAVAGTPRYGGTLTLVGQGDVDFLDPNVSYYTAGYAAARLWSRQLVTFPAVEGATNTGVVADLAQKVPTRANKLISADGLRVTIHIDPRAKWNTSPPRSVTADDAIRGVLRSCNPSRPNGALADYEDEIVGLTKLCDDFAQVPQTAPAINAFLRARLHSVRGLSVGADPQTMVFTLTRPTVYFVSQLTMPAFNPAPAEVLSYMPGTADMARHAPADGPYEIESYTANASLVFRRNSAWDDRSD